MKMNYKIDEPRKFVLSILSSDKDGTNTVILTGKPGTGKTSLAEFFAQQVDAEYYYQLCHHWLSEEEMFIGIDIGAVAVGVNDRESAYQPGVLLKVAEASQRGKVVLCVDELDKAPTRMEVLLLDFLQTGRVYLPGDGYIQANLENLYVFITSNEQRPLLAPTLRRGFRLEMDFLPANDELDIIRKKTGGEMAIIKLIVRMIREIRTNGETSPSLQEGINVCRTIDTVNSPKECEMLLKGWLCKEEGDWQALERAYTRPHHALWGQVKRARGGSE